MIEAVSAIGQDDVGSSTFPLGLESHEDLHWVHPCTLSIWANLKARLGLQSLVLRMMQFLGVGT